MKSPRLATSKWTAGLAAALVLAVLPATGCTKESKASGGPDPAIAAGADSNQPFALFLGEKLGNIDYAQRKIRNQCLADAGYPQNLQVMMGRPRNPFSHLVVTPKTFGPVSEQEARQTGFGQDVPASPPSVVSFDPNYDKVFDDCTKKAWAKLSDKAEKVYFGYFDLGNALGSTFLKTVNERVAASRWKELLSCLGAKGHRTAKEEDFLRSPSPEQFGVELGEGDKRAEQNWQPKQVPGTVEVGPAVPAQRYQPSPQEAALAVAWVQCRRDTGIAQQQLDIAVAVQRELVAKNESSLVELNPQIESMAKKAADLIGAQ